MKYLVENGVDVNAQTIRCETPLMFANENGNLNVVQYLVENGAQVDEVDSVNNDGETSLFHNQSEEQQK